MERVVHIAKSHQQARDWDIQQVVKMTVEQRQEIAKRLKKKAFKQYSPDVRESRSYHIQTTP